MTHDVIVLGGDIAGFTRLDIEVTSSAFDDDTDTWTLTTAAGETCHAQVVVACESPFVPWTPSLAGRDDFRGPSFHAATPGPDFEPDAQRIAVIGADATAGRLIDRWTPSAASIEVFPFAPRRVVPKIARARRYLRRQAELVASPVEQMTATGVRTADGVHHEADAIVYGTGFAVRAGLPPHALVGARGVTIHQAWHAGMEPYLGVALHAFPNYFIIHGPDFEAAVLECLQLMKGHTRIEVRRSSQQVFNERVHLRRPTQRLAASAFDLSSSIGASEDIYDGPATLTLADTCRQVRVRLTGHVDPIDGQYHWQGTVFDQLPTELLRRARAVNLAVGERSVRARITEETPQGAHSIAGVGAPPFALADIERQPHV